MYPTKKGATSKHLQFFRKKNNSRVYFFQNFRFLGHLKYAVKLDTEKIILNLFTSIGDCKNCKRSLMIEFNQMNCFFPISLFCFQPKLRYNQRAFWLMDYTDMHFITVLKNFIYLFIYWHCIGEDIGSRKAI